MASSPTYFYDHNYLAIYLHSFFNAFGKSIITIFSAVILYQRGVPLWGIFLLYAYQFGIMGLLTPLSPLMVARYWLAVTLITSNTFRIACLGFLFLNLDPSVPSVLLVFGLSALDQAIYNPISNGLNAVYVRTEDKSRVNSLLIIVMAISMAISIPLSAYLIVTWHYFILLSLTLWALTAAILPYIFLLDHRNFRMETSFMDVYRFLWSHEFRENIAPFGAQSFMIIERIFIPLFIYFQLGDLKKTAYVISFSILSEIAIIYIFGRKSDVFEKKSFLLATSLKSATSVFFVFGGFGHVVWAYFLQTYAKITENLFNNSFNSLLQRKAKWSNPAVFSAAKEMTLCFTEVFVLMFLSLVAYVFAEKTFYLVFLGSFIAVWGMYRTWKD